MRRYEKMTETREVEHLTELRCDLCGRIGKGTNRSWDGATFDVNETEIEVTIIHQSGVAYPDGGNTTRYTIDMCPECFRDRLVPWIESQGGSVARREFDY